MLIEFDATLSSLSALDLPDKTHERKLMSAVMDKVPIDLQTFLTELDEKTVRSVRKALDKKLRQLETNRAAFATSPPGAAPATRAPRIHNTAAYTQPAARSRAHTAAVAKTCVFCEQLHRPIECPVYSSVQSRINRITELRLCLLCFRPGHSKPECRRKIVCYDCGEPHYRSLSNKSRTKSVNFNPDTTVHTEGRLNLISACRPEIDVLSCVRGQVMLATSQCPNVVRSPLLTTVGRASLMTQLIDVQMDGRVSRIRVLIDPGADICLVSRRLCERVRLDLRPSHLRHLIVAGGLSSTRIDCCAEVPICPPGRSKVGRILAYVMDHITEPIGHSLHRW